MGNVENGEYRIQTHETKTKKTEDQKTHMIKIEKVQKQARKNINENIGRVKEKK